VHSPLVEHVAALSRDGRGSEGPSSPSQGGGRCGQGCSAHGQGCTGQPGKGAAARGQDGRRQASLRARVWARVGEERDGASAARC
jgi:hypothetical protein